MRDWRCFDRILLGYLAMVAVLILAGDRSRVAHWPWLLLAHVLVLVLVPYLIRTGSRKTAPGWVTGLRGLYPLLLFPLCYRESQHLNQLFIAGYLDPVVIRWEAALFGCQPSLEMMTAMPWWPLSELLHAAYFAFYVMVAGLALYLWFHDREQQRHFLAVMTMVFCGCYLSFIFLPIAGPRLFLGPVEGYALPDSLMPPASVIESAAIATGWMRRWIGVLYEHGEGVGGAFPSSHVAVAVCTVLFSFRYVRRIRYVHLLVFVLLCIATVYGRYHYAVDVLAGLLAAALLIPLGEWAHRRWDGGGVRPD